MRYTQTPAQHQAAKPQDHQHGLHRITAEPLPGRGLVPGALDFQHLSHQSRHRVAVAKASGVRLGRKPDNAGAAEADEIETIPYMWDPPLLPIFRFTDQPCRRCFRRVALDTAADGASLHGKIWQTLRLPTPPNFDEAKTQGWTIVDMKRGWRRIFEFAPPKG